MADYLICLAANAGVVRALGADAAEVPALAVRPELQGNRLGRLLLALLENTLHKAGVKLLAMPALVPYPSCSPKQGAPADGHMTAAMASPTQEVRCRLQAKLKYLFHNKKTGPGGISHARESLSVVCVALNGMCCSVNVGFAADGEFSDVSAALQIPTWAKLMGYRQATCAQLARMAALPVLHFHGAQFAVKELSVSTCLKVRRSSRPLSLPCYKMAVRAVLTLVPPTMRSSLASCCEIYQLLEHALESGCFPDSEHMSACRYWVYIVLGLTVRFWTFRFSRQRSCSSARKLTSRTSARTSCCSQRGSQRTQRSSSVPRRRPEHPGPLPRSPNGQQAGPSQCQETLMLLVLWL